MLKRFGLVFICALNLRLLVGFIFCFTAQSRKFAVYAQCKSVLLPSRLASKRKFVYLQPAKSAK